MGGLEQSIYEYFQKYSKKLRYNGRTPHVFMKYAPSEEMRLEIFSFDGEIRLKTLCSLSWDLANHFVYWPNCKPERKQTGFKRYMQKNVPKLRE